MAGWMNGPRPPCWEPSPLNVDRWRMVCLVVACLGMTTAGPILGFTIYANAYKYIFGLTQSQLEVIISLSLVVDSCGFHIPLLQNILGFRILCLIGTALSVVGCSLVSISTNNPQSTMASTPLLTLYAVILSFGVSTITISCLGTATRNYSGHVLGKLVGALTASYSMGLSVTALVYNTFFINGAYSEPRKQNLGGFFVFLAIYIGSNGVLASLFLNIYPRQKEETPLKGNFADIDYSLNSGYIARGDSLSGDEADGSMQNPNKLLHDSLELSKHTSVRGWILIKNKEFQLLLWGWLLLSGPQLTLYNNITTILFSLDAATSNGVVTIVWPIVVAVFRVLSGHISDKTIDKIPRSLYALISGCIQFGAFILIAFFPTPWIVVTAMFIIGVMYATYCTMFLAMLHELFGPHYYTLNSTGFFCGAALVTLVLQLLFGWLYDAKAIEVRFVGESCFGIQCYQLSMIAYIGIQVVGVICIAALYRIHRISYCNRSSDINSRNKG